VNGADGRSNNYTVNGGDGNDLFANLARGGTFTDSIEEFRVISNAFDAEYGRNSGAVVNVVTKSARTMCMAALDLTQRSFEHPTLQLLALAKRRSNKISLAGQLAGQLRKTRPSFRFL